MTSSKPIDLVLVLDANYENYASFLISQLVEYSLRQHADNFRFNLLTFDDFFPHKLLSESAQKSISVRVFQNDYKVFNPSIQHSGHISKVAYLKLLIGEVLPRDVRRCIYLDVDILVNDQTPKIFNQECKLNSLIISNVEPGGSTHHPLFAAVPEMFSAGFMILNLELWRNLEFSKVCLDILNEHGPLPWADNDIIILAMNRIGLRCQPLDFALHFIPGKYGDSQLAGRNPVLVHFPGAGKPWNSPFGGKYARTYRRRFRKYDPTFSITMQAYQHYFFRRIRDYLYIIFMSFRKLKSIFGNFLAKQS
jgi:lipopolysaccharide biosynthesis glycosyltransferase